LRERNARERERVEQALAAPPLFPEPSGSSDGKPEYPPHWRNRSVGFLQVETPLSGAFGEGLEPVVCPVCAATEIDFDEVAQLGTLRLSECRRCDHRWTTRSPERWAEVGAKMNRVAVRVRKSPRIGSEPARRSYAS